MKKVIQYYRKDVFGVVREYVVDKGDAGIIQRLTGQKTINGVVRELIRDLSGGNIEFKEVIAPN